MYAKTSPRIDGSLNHPTQRQSRGASVDRDDLESNGNGHSTPVTPSSSTASLLPRHRRNDSPRGRSKASRCGFFDSQTKYGNTAYLISLGINIVLLVIICLSFYSNSPTCAAENPLVNAGVADLGNDISIPPILTEDRDHEEEPQTQQQPKKPIIEAVAQPDLDEEPVVRRNPANQQQPEQPITPPIKQVDPTPAEPASEVTKPVEPVHKSTNKQSIDQSNQHKALSPSLISPGEGGTRVFFTDDASDHLGADAHQVDWDYCLTQSDTTPVVDGYFRYSYNLTWQTFPWEACATNPTSEQSWQITWYGGQVAVGVTERQFPVPQRCVVVPPLGYQWPPKYTALPAVDQSFFHWQNLRVQKYEDLIIFNPGTPKNLYHFEAPRYDLDGLDELALAAQYIPFASKVRTFLDIGAGGASLGLLMRRKYRVDTISVIFPDWPYCEYISERGGLCVLVDAMEAMPFARGAFDVIHVSWVYHGQHPHELIEMFMEVDRVVRPGGYVWQRGGFSMQQIEAMKHLFALLGYTPLHDKIKRVDREKVRIQFGSEGDIPFEAEWSCIYVKPTSAVKQVGCNDASVPEYGTIKTPL